MGRRETTDELRMQLTYCEDAIEILRKHLYNSLWGAIVQQPMVILDNEDIMEMFNVARGNVELFNQDSNDYLFEQAMNSISDLYVAIQSQLQKDFISQNEK